MEELTREQKMEAIFLGPKDGSQINKPSNFEYGPRKKARKIFILKIVGVVLAVVVIGAAGIYFWPKGKTVIANNYEGKWQAVFLNNDQVYFGHVASEDEQQIILDDVYYPQKPISLQQGGDTTAQGDFTLVKMGGEIYGTEDKMSINREMVLFVANLKDNSKVTQAIEKHKEKK